MIGQEVPLPPPTLGQQLMAILILFMSGCGIGGALYIALAPLRMGPYWMILIRDRYERGALKGALVGFSLMVGLIAILIAQTGRVKIEPRVWVYALGALLTGAGFAFLAVRSLLRYRKLRKRSDELHAKPREEEA